MKILIAEDDLDACRLLHDLLSQWGYEPIVAHDGLAALRILQGPNAPRLGILDWQMPWKDGIDVCREIRRDPTRPYSYLLLLTGIGGRQEMIEGLSAGADDFVTKPVDVAELQARLGTGRRIIHLQEQLLAAQQLLREQATRDALTGLWNRAAVIDLLDRELALSQRDGFAVGVLLADIDHFKQVNDTLGHLAGDLVLHEAARRLRAALRSYDSIGRYGGEEFLVVLPGCDSRTALGLGERLRQAVAAQPVVWEASQLVVTISVGATAVSGPAGADRTAVLRAADTALYRAKRDGRNRVELEPCPLPGQDQT